MASISNVLRQLYGAQNVALLRRLVTPSEQQQQPIAALRVVDAVPRAEGRSSVPKHHRSGVDAGPGCHGPIDRREPGLRARIARDPFNAPIQSRYSLVCSTRIAAV